MNVLQVYFGLRHHLGTSVSHLTCLQLVTDR
jgi:hypothetical protein